MGKFRIEFKWAIIFIAMMLVWMILERLVGLHDKHIEHHLIYTNFVAIPAILIYFLALRDKRLNYYQGPMTFGQGFLSGLIITLIVTIFSPVSQLITSYIITPHYFENVIKYTVEHGMKTQAEAEAFFNIKAYIISGLIYTPVMGIITSLIAAPFNIRKGK
ncbi:MAG: DUF4199 domain-containing protein [Bacteroidales bacterium]|nr:DUF4199 domain-containing protein [Bacteroidales bacterium]